MKSIFRSTPRRRRSKPPPQHEAQAESPSVFFQPKLTISPTTDTSAKRTLIQYNTQNHNQLNSTPMQTLFECWNGGQIAIQNNQPWFGFQFPAHNQEVLSFFQLSARIWETMAGVDCYLSMGGQAFDVPNFPVEEVNYVVANVQRTMGYAPYVIPHMAPTNFGNSVPVNVVVWVNLGTGRADMYNPFAGYVYGQQLIMPQTQQFQPTFYNQFNMSIQTNGGVQGTGQKSTLAKLAGIMKDMNAVFGETGKMYDFFDQRFDFGGGNGGDWSGGGGW